MRITSCEKGRDKKRRRRTLSITIDPDVLGALRQWMEKEEEHNLSAVIEGFIECGIRDTCDGCPDYVELPQEEREKITRKVGVGKWGGD